MRFGGRAQRGALLAKTIGASRCVGTKRRANRVERLRVFCASMADVFDPEAPAEERERLWELIRETPYLDWQVLTKRPERIAEYLPADWECGYSNVWLGTSVEDETRHRAHFAACRSARNCSLSGRSNRSLGPLSKLPLDDIEWAIVGGESGPGARPDASRMGRRDSAAMRKHKCSVLL